MQRGKFNAYELVEKVGMDMAVVSLWICVRC